MPHSHNQIILNIPIELLLQLQKRKKTAWPAVLSRGLERDQGDVDNTALPPIFMVVRYPGEGWSDVTCG